MATTRVGRWLGLFLMIVEGGAGPGLAEAVEIKVLSAGAMRSIVTDVAEACRKDSGHSVTLTFGTVGVGRQKLTAGEPADVVIMTDVAIVQMAEQGLVVAGTRTDIARTGMGVGVREGAPRPIPTPEAFKQAVHAGEVDADAVKTKTRLVPGGYPAELVAKGEAEMVV